jgi:multidrug efflux pump subunit AcrA (membrane-fusion protein)
MFINASILADSSAENSELFLPKTSLIEKGQLKGIYTYSEDGLAILRWVRTGKEYQDKVEILSGIREGDRVIISSEGRLFNGVPVTL